MTKETYIKELDKILKRATLIEELENLKTEIKEVSYSIINIDEFYELGYRIADIDDINEIIDKHIKEMKGDK